jgi:trafficking protein particle complex subunit 10
MHSVGDYLALSVTIAYQGDLPKFFIETWIYSSALSVVEQCDTWAVSIDFEKSALLNYQAAKGELLHLAANQVLNVSLD